MFDAIIRKRYTCFYDKMGILQGGLWILFEENIGNIIFEVLPSRILGDILLAKQDSTIVGIAIPAVDKPEDYDKYITDYCRNIRKNRPRNKIYLYLLKKLINCDFKVTQGLIMTKTGVVTTVNSRF